jgi:hypothetical protein
MEQATLEGVGRRLENAVATLEKLEMSLEPSLPPDFANDDVEFVGIYYHHIWQVTLGLLAVEAITGEQRAAFRKIFGEDVDVAQMRRLRASAEFQSAIAAFTDFIQWIIVFEGSLVAFDSRASRMQGMSLELVSVFEDLITELFLVDADDISWRTHRFAKAIQALRSVLATRWGTTRPFAH